VNRRISIIVLNKQATDRVLRGTETEADLEGAKQEEPGTKGGQKFQPIPSVKP
jgi:hypothetical protein